LPFLTSVRIIFLQQFTKGKTTPLISLYVYPHHLTCGSTGALSGGKLVGRQLVKSKMPNKSATEISQKQLEIRKIEQGIYDMNMKCPLQAHVLGVWLSDDVLFGRD
jgi:hypothetical protein